MPPPPRAPIIQYARSASDMACTPCVAAGFARFGPGTEGPNGAKPPTRRVRCYAMPAAPTWEPDQARRLDSEAGVDQPEEDEEGDGGADVQGRVVEGAKPALGSGGGSVDGRHRGATAPEAGVPC